MMNFLLSITERQGSTRSLGCIRILLVFLLWSRFAAELQFFRNFDYQFIALGSFFFASSFLFCIGLFTRSAGAVLACTLLCLYYYFGYVLDVEPWTHHHVYVLMWSTVLLALSPCGKSFSIDRLILLKRSAVSGQPVPPEIGHVWILWVFRLQICLIYFWSAFDKTSVAYLSGERMEMILMYLYFGSDPTPFPGFHPIMQISAIGSVLLEFVLAVGLWFSSLRAPLLLVGFLFHALIYITLPVATYSLTMWVLYLTFFDPDDCHHWIDTFLGKPAATL